MSNIRATLWRIFGILFIFSITFTAYAQQEQQPTPLSQSQFEKILEKIDRGVEKARLGHYEAAILDYDVAIRINSEDADTYFNRGLCKKRLGRTAEANQDFQKALSLAEKAGDAELITTIKKHIKMRL